MQMELKENEGLSDLIKYSGGLPVTAQTTKVNISRITPTNKRSKDIVADRELITFNYEEAKNSNKNQLEASHFSTKLLSKSAKSQ